jgi:phosphoglycerol transferase
MRSWPPWIAWAAGPIAVVGALWLALGGTGRDVRTPLRYSGDELVTLAEVQASMDRGSWWTLADLSLWPQKDPLLSPRHAHLDSVLLSVSRLVSRRAAEVATLGWVLMLVLGGASATWCARRLGISVIGAWGTGVLFALCPFALSRNTIAWGLMPYLVPCAATAALLLALDRLGPGQGRAGLFVGTGLLGLNGPYYAWCGAWLLLIGALAGYRRTRRLAPLWTGACLLFAITAATVGNVRLSAGPSTSAATSVVQLKPRPAQADWSGLQIRQLVSPWPDHWFGPLRRWASLDLAARFPYGDKQAQLGLVGALGFLWLLVVLLVPSLAAADDSGDVTRGASRLTIAVVLLGTVGGLGSVLTAHVVPFIRNYTFVVPFIAFFALLAVAAGLDRATAARHGWRAGVWAVVVAIGLCDQAVALGPVNARHSATSEEHGAARAFVSTLERRLPAGARVALLPLQPYPALEDAARTAVLDHLKLIVASQNVRWSQLDLAGEQRRWYAETSSLAPNDLVAYFRKVGFSAVVIDRRGYDDRGEAVLAGLQSGLSIKMPVVQDSRYVAFVVREP